MIGPEGFCFSCRAGTREVHNKLEKNRWGFPVLYLKFGGLEVSNLIQSFNQPLSALCPSDEHTWRSALKRWRRTSPTSTRRKPPTSACWEARWDTFRWALCSAASGSYWDFFRAGLSVLSVISILKTTRHSEEGVAGQETCFSTVKVWLDQIRHNRSTSKQKENPLHKAFKSVFIARFKHPLDLTW